MIDAEPAVGADARRLVVALTPAVDVEGQRVAGRAAGAVGAESARRVVPQRGGETGAVGGEDAA